MTRTLARRALAAAALILGATAVGTLAGCASPSPQAPTTAEPVASPSAEPVPDADPLTTVTTVVLRPEHLDLVDAGGTVVTELSYDAEATEIAGTLEVVFGAAPSIEEFGGVCCEAPRTTNYHWGGFTVIDDHMGSFTDDDERVWIDDDGPDIHEMNVRVSAEAALVGEIAVTAANGFAIGGDLDALEGRVEHPGGPDWSQVPLETGPELGPAVIEGVPYAYSVIVQVAGPGAAPQLVAPVNLGAHTV